MQNCLSVTRNSWVLLCKVIFYFSNIPGLRKHDVCFLITIRAKKAQNQIGYDRKQPFADQVSD